MLENNINDLAIIVKVKVKVKRIEND